MVKPLTSIITILIFRVQEYSIVTQTLMLVWLGMLWILLASLENPEQNTRIIHVVVGGLARVAGAAALFVVILMLLTVIMTDAYRNLAFIVGAVVFLAIFGALVSSIPQAPRR